MGFLNKLFGGSTTVFDEELVERLLSTEETVRNQAITQATGLVEDGNREGLNALAEAIRRKAGKSTCRFYEPGVAMYSASEIGSAPRELVRLASKQSLLNDVEKTGQLISASRAAGGYDTLQQIAAAVTRAGGDDQYHALQLIYSHIHSQAVWKRDH